MNILYSFLILPLSWLTNNLQYKIKYVDKSENCGYYSECDIHTRKKAHYGDCVQLGYEGISLLVAMELVFGGFLHFWWDKKRLSDAGSLAMCIYVFMNITFPPLPRDGDARDPPPPLSLRSAATQSLLLLWLGWDEMWTKNMGLLNSASWGGPVIRTTADLRLLLRFMTFYFVTFLCFNEKWILKWFRTFPLGILIFLLSVNCWIFCRLMN